MKNGVLTSGKRSLDGHVFEQNPPLVETLNSLTEKWTPFPRFSPDSRKALGSWSLEWPQMKVWDMVWLIETSMWLFVNPPLLCTFIFWCCFLPSYRGNCNYFLCAFWFLPPLGKSTEDLDWLYTYIYIHTRTADILNKVTENNLKD